jgi:membrane protease YdiL (CAAX protease family)
MSKLLLKLAGITSIITACMYLFIFVIVHLTIPYNYMSGHMYDYVTLMIVASLSLISGFGAIIFLHYKDLSEEELKGKKTSILVWSIIFFLTSGISGIFGLAAYGCLCDNGHINSRIDYIEEIKELERLKQKGLITDEEFARKKKKILDI